MLPHSRFIILTCHRPLIKTGHFTLDNASNNASGMHELDLLLTDRKIDFDQFNNRVMYVILSFSSTRPNLLSGAFRM